MADPLSVVIAGGALVASLWSGRTASRALRIAEAEHKQRESDRNAKPALSLTVRPSNHRLGEDGVIRTGGTTTYVVLAIDVANTGPGEAGRTLVTAWVPRYVEGMTLDWVTDAGLEIDRMLRPAPDPLTLHAEGHDHETWRMTWTLDDVSRVGETLYLRLPCPVPVRGTSVVPVRVLARASDDEAETTYLIRLLNVPA